MNNSELSSLYFKLSFSMQHNNMRTFCTFHLGELCLGIPVNEVQEVIRSHAMTRVPLANEAIRGLINLRGQIVTAIDLRNVLKLQPRCSEALPMNVVVRDGDQAVSLLVDHIGDVVEVGEQSFELPPSTLCAQLRELITGAYKLPERLLLVLNIQHVIETLNAEHKLQPV
jgi:purine-binding chemotaxis protein CheW